jgi:putative chitinase
MSTELVVCMVAPGAARFAKPLEDACIRWGIVTTLQKCHFLAQVAHESAGFRYVHELGSQAYLSKYDTGSLAERLGNTPEEDGDGEKFCGRGLIQITGRYNYGKASQALYGSDRLIGSPELLEEPEAAASSAGWYWHDRDINTEADADDLRGVTRKINGGTNGLAGRGVWLAKFKQAFESIKE